MKKTIFFLIVITFSNVVKAQTRAIPDINFEQELINLGYDIGVPDGVVLTASIDTIQILSLNFKNIISLAGIEGFIALKSLYLNHNQLTNLDVAQNIALINLECSYNSLTNLNVKQNVNLTVLSCFSNQLTNLNVSQNTSLRLLNCGDNQLTSINISQNTALTFLSCSSNQLNCLNAKNGNNTILSIYAGSNPNLNCIEVDDVIWATANWTFANANMDTVSSFSNNCGNTCSTVGISEYHISKFNIYPNPVSSQLTIDTDLDISEVIIFDFSGKIIKTQNQHKKLVDLADLPSGIYFIKVIINGNIITKQFVKL